MQWMRAQPWNNGKVGLIGSCSGGRQAFLYACKRQDIDCVVDLWGGRVVQVTPHRRTLEELFVEGSGTRAEEMRS